MNKKLETIKKAIEEDLNNKNLIVDSINWEVEGKYNYLKIILDSDTTLDIDRIVEATHIINPILDKLDLIEGEYILDISSKERG